MKNYKLPSLDIGDISICPPVIQGGMGVRVSMAALASAVADTGCAGVIASAGLGVFEETSGHTSAKKLNEDSFRAEIRKARSMTNGVIGVNIMHALTNYEELVKIAIEEGVDLIISGAGLPLDLPRHLNGQNVKLIPVVSSAKAFKIICRAWKSRYNKIPDAVIVEGPKAGGHLGYDHHKLETNTADLLEMILAEVLEVAEAYEPKIPVIAAGGIFDGADIAHFIELGASGVQMGTRFVCTNECEVADEFKQAYINATEDDITIIKSPVGMPGRVINNEFVKKIKNGQEVPFVCKFKCLKTCDPKTAPYCIAKVLADASNGKMDRAFAFAGSNAYRCNEIVSVKALVEQLCIEFNQAISTRKATFVKK